MGAEGKSVPEAYHAKQNLARLERGEKLPTELPYLVQVWNSARSWRWCFCRARWWWITGCG